MEKTLTFAVSILENAEHPGNDDDFERFDESSDDDLDDELGEQTFHLYATDEEGLLEAVIIGEHLSGVRIPYPDGRLLPSGELVFPVILVLDWFYE